METIMLHEPNEIRRDQEKKVIVLGFFDGVHRGHQKVIRTAKDISQKEGLKLAVLTFDPHPSIVLSSNKGAIKYLTPLAEKSRRIEALDVDYFYVVRFTSPFSKLTPEQFVKNYLLHLGGVHVVAGFDYTYGYLGKGSISNMERDSSGLLKVTIVEKQMEAKEKISSTAIREAIQYGKLELANQLLGSPYVMKGTVIHGDERGRTIGFPTANILIEENYLIPQEGVYAVKVKVGNVIYNGMASIGHNITFKTNQALSIEINILDFKQDIYGEELEIFWYHYFRSEVKFNGIEELRKQLQVDEEHTRHYFANLLN